MSALARFAKKGTPSSRLLTSRRSMFLLRQFGRMGEQLDLPDNCTIEFPDAKEGETPGSSADKYKRFVVHYRPEEGLYAGGVYRFEFDVTDVPEYPDKPPKVRCLTRVWHPNIALDGRVCHNFLQANPIYGEGCGYTPALGLSSLVNGVITMFDVDSSDRHSDSFNPASPLNTEAAEQFVKDYAAFVRAARDYTRQYAQPVPIKPWCLASDDD